jgi:hypothetical protein
MRGSNAIIMVLTGKYPDLWSVSLRRIYEYGRGLDVVLVNAGGFHRELAINVAMDYGFSYFESYQTTMSRHKTIFSQGMHVQTSL